MKNYRYKIALAAPSLYAQFGAPATRPMVLAAVLNLGFDDVYEVATARKSLRTARRFCCRRPEGKAVCP
jgi:hypothetical protein